MSEAKEPEIVRVVHVKRDEEAILRPDKRGRFCIVIVKQENAAHNKTH